MEELPSPLQIASPTAASPSSDYVPSALRAGSPAVDAPTHRRPPARKNTSGSDRLSQLFPSRPPSTTPPGSEFSLSRRTSYPSPLTPAAEPSYRIPRAPAPPSFSEDTSYKSSPDPFETHHVQPTLKKSGTKRLLNRLASLRSGGASGGAYGKLDDEESGPDRGRLKHVDEVDEPVGYDLSGYEGMPMSKFEIKRLGSAAEEIQQEREMNEAAHAAEFEHLESQLGAGMTSISEVPFTYKGPDTGQTTDHKRGLSDSREAGLAAQIEAQKTGGIVAAGEL